MRRGGDAEGPSEIATTRRRARSSETRVKRGDRVIGADTELIEKVGHDDRWSNGSGHQVSVTLPQPQRLRRRASAS
jgi:hypothetical protein